MDADPSQAGASIAAVSALADPLRGRMYAFIRNAHRPVTRDEAASSVGISRKLAAHHLDKLVDAGLLRAHFAPVGGVRRVGRTPKVYEPSNLELQVSIPSRHHDLLAEVLIEAISTQGTGSAHRAAEQIAHERGRQVGLAQRRTVRAGRLGAARALTLAADALTRGGFEPQRVREDCIRLRNCPFHPLAARSPQLVCAINHSYLSGLIHGLDTSTVTAVLNPGASECCVEVHAVPGHG